MLWLQQRPGEFTYIYPRAQPLTLNQIKSNFLASMSHELRTPFSSFYGLLDILSGTELNSGQLELGIAQVLPW